MQKLGDLLDEVLAQAIDEHLLGINFNDAHERAIETQNAFCK